MTQVDDKQKYVQQIEKQIAEIEQASSSAAAREEVDRLREQIETLRQSAETGATDAWSHVLLARHPQRPYTLDWFSMLFTDFTELHGDRRFADDPAMVGGFAHFEGRPVMVVGQQKGRDTKQKLHRNFGMSNPEGYRKALRLMQLAAKFDVPIFTFVDTPGAYPGIGAEERGQAEAIAYNLKEIPKLAVPIVVVIHGEGGSGGALGIAIGDRILMLENAIYSVISPESCSEILWRDWTHKQESASALKLTAADLYGFKIIDEVVPEPPGGCHADPHRAAALLRPCLSRALQEASALPRKEMLRQRQEKLRRVATFVVES